MLHKLCRLKKLSYISGRFTGHWMGLAKWKQLEWRSWSFNWPLPLMFSCFKTKSALAVVWNKCNPDTMLELSYILKKSFQLWTPGSVSAGFEAKDHHGWQQFQCLSYFLRPRDTKSWIQNNIIKILLGVVVDAQSLKMWNKSFLKTLKLECEVKKCC